MCGRDTAHEVINPQGAGRDGDISRSSIPPRSGRTLEEFYATRDRMYQLMSPSGLPIEMPAPACLLNPAFAPSRPGELFEAIGGVADKASYRYEAAIRAMVERWGEGRAGFEADLRRLFTPPSVVRTADDWDDAFAGLGGDWDYSNQLQEATT